MRIKDCRNPNSTVAPTVYVTRLGLRISKEQPHRRCVCGDEARILTSVSGDEARILTSVCDDEARRILTCVGVAMKLES
ncbi:hypothetical protein RRG08_024279 [Elysia crispata]|uniref:Uncharacterized protein n=1 Tax=Elysia crispata TaxID=231223 RepID=A0AAE0Z3Y9_9GAST|nr:hypothetical protein RRG08_024279 [Elysia crispata]